MTKGVFFYSLIAFPYQFFRYLSGQGGSSDSQRKEGNTVVAARPVQMLIITYVSECWATLVVDDTCDSCGPRRASSLQYRLLILQYAQFMVHKSQPVGARCP